MARKHGQKESSNLVFHGKTFVAMDHDSQVNVKHLVSKVQEVVPNYSNHEIALVLQYYDNNVANTIAAFTEDGAAAALKDWNYHSKKSNKANNKKKKKANQKSERNESEVSLEKEKEVSRVASQNKIEESGPSAEEAFPRPRDHSSSVSGSENTEESIVNAKDDNVVKTEEKNIINAKEENQKQSSDFVPERQPTPVNNSCKKSENCLENIKQPVDNPQISDSKHSHKRIKSGNSGGRLSRSSSESKEFPEKSSNHSHLTTYLGGKGLEKSVKDLNRQTISLQRTQHLLSEELDNSFKRLSTSFNEIHQLLNDREVELMSELELIKKEANNLLKHRQETASRLKVQVDKAQVMTESELIDLRADIKHFVSERKLDEELGRTIRFCRNSDKLIQEVKNFGEVNHVKNLYTTRRPTIHTNVISHTVVETSPVKKESNPTPTVAEPAKPDDDIGPTNFEVHGPGSSMVISSSSLTPSELAELQQRLQDSLKLQGLTVTTSSFSNTFPRTVRSQSTRPAQSGGNYRNQTSNNNQCYGNWKWQNKPRDQPRTNSYRDSPHREGSGYKTRGPRPHVNDYGPSNNFDSEQKQSFGKRAVRPKNNIPNRSNSSQFDAKHQNSEHFNGVCEDENHKKQTSKDLNTNQNTNTSDAPLPQRKPSQKASKIFEQSNEKKLINGINQEMNGLTNMQNSLNP